MVLQLIRMILSWRTGTLIEDFFNRILSIIISEVHTEPGKLENRSLLRKFRENLE